MRSPNTGSSMREVENEATLHTLRGETFMVGSPAWECPDTGERYFTPEQGNIFLSRVHAAWRERHGISKEALRQRRKALGLSAAQASALLGFGVNQYRTYENTDKLPSKSNARLLRLLLDDPALPALVKAAGAALNAAGQRKVQAYLARPVAQVIIPRVSNRRFVTLTNRGDAFDLAPDEMPANLLAGFTRFDEAPTAA